MIRRRSRTYIGKGDDVLAAGRKAIMGALTLYLDFITCSCS